MENPDDPAAVPKEAVALIQQGRYEESLQKHLWFHDHALEQNLALAGVRLSFALSYWIELGERYPEARRALADVRDRKAKAMADGEGPPSLFHDVSAINQAFEEQPKTVALFKLLHQKYPEFAGQCYHVAEADLVAHREYEVCASYIPIPAARFEEIRQIRQVQLELAVENPALGAHNLRGYAEQRFADETCRVIEILIGAGRRREAVLVRGLALAESDNAELRAALDRTLQFPDPDS